MNVAGLVVLAAQAACGGGGGRDEDEVLACPAATPDLAPPAVELPPPAAAFDYQLGGAYDAPPGVGVVGRDRADAPAVGAYGICYVNGFQTQPGSDWSGDNDALVLRDGSGRRVQDPDWPDEYLFDLSSAPKREQLAGIVGGWIAQCAADGFEAVELDNLDSFSRSHGRFSFEDASAYALQLLAVAHRNGLAVAQKNTAEAATCLRSLGFDFAVTEECWAWDECDTYTLAYGDRVFDVEYDARSFQEGCAAARAPAPIRRDRDLVPPGPGYLREQCSETRR